MGIVTTEKVDNLWWMGRYVERVFTSMKIYIRTCDDMIDKNPECFRDYCEKLGIGRNYYADGKEFRERYAFDEKDPSSILSSMVRAVDNAIILRETISSDTLAYLELVLAEFKRHSQGGFSDYFRLQRCIDYILAFWGSVEENILNEQIRNIARAGKRLERLDLMLRTSFPMHEDAKTACYRLRIRLERSGMPFNEDNLSTLEGVLAQDPVNSEVALSLLQKILD